MFFSHFSLCKDKEDLAAVVEAENVMTKLDDNPDNLLNKFEFFAFLNEKYPDQYSMKQSNQLFDEADKDGSGKIDRSELIALIQSQQEEDRKKYRTLKSTEPFLALQLASANAEDAAAAAEEEERAAAEAVKIKN
jgi:hypothetical protein